MAEVKAVTLGALKDSKSVIKVVRAQRGYLYEGIQKALKAETVEDVRKELEHALKLYDTAEAMGE